MEEEKTKEGRGILSGLALGVVVLLAKGKGIILFLVSKLGTLLSLVKVVNLSKILLTFSTMAASVLAYSGRYGFPFALGLVLLILIHELGHGIAAKRMGLAVGAPIFIPFFGAVIALKEQPKTTWVESVVGFGGPFAGLMGSVVCMALADLDLFPPYSHLLYGLAHFSFVINLFNLIPIFGLDGDRITAPMGAGFIALSAALVFLGGVAIYGEKSWPEPLFVIISAFLIFKALRRGFTRGNYAEGVTAHERLTAFFAFNGLALGLIFLAAHSSRYIS